MTSKNLDAYRDSQSARLVVEDFKPVVVAPNGRGGIHVKGSLSVTNPGPTAATVVFQSVDDSFGAGRAPHSFEGTTVGINVDKPPNGPWLPIGGKYEIPVEGDSDASLEALKARKIYFSYTLSLAYKDIFGRVFWVFDCYMYDASSDGFIHCPSSARRPPNR